MAQPFIGNKITLVSVSQIRYEGVLAAVNQAESTVSLQNVQMLGTEGRRGAAGEQEILPNNQVYSFIEFRASDILELQVIEEALPPFQDPAIISRGDTQAAAGGAAGGAVVSSPSSPAPAAPGSPKQQQQRRQALPTAIKQRPDQRKNMTQKERQRAHEEAKLERLRKKQQGQQQQGQQQQGQQQQQQQQRQQSQSSAAPVKPAVVRIDPGKPAWGGNAAKSLQRQKKPQGNNGGNGGRRQQPQRNGGRQQQQQQQQQHGRPQQQQYRNNNNNRNNNYNNNNQRGGRNNNRGPASGTGAALLNRGTRGQTKSGISAAEIKGKDFDFEAGLDKLSEIVADDLNVDDASEDSDADDVAYSKTNSVDSFFDSISCEATERAANGGRRQRPDRQAQRQQNLEAFGVEGLQRERGYRGNRNNRNNRNNYYNNNNGNNNNRSYNNRNNNRNWRQRNNNNNSHRGGGRGGNTQWSGPGAQNAANAGQ
jgi:protein LSM14